MSDEKNTGSTESKIDKKILENPFVGSLVVPIAIVLVGALVVFGVTKMISSETSYKDLVREMKSKTFGNKWVAALELSKVISAGKIPEEDIPWLIENLDDIYTNTIDVRTKDFIVVAAGAIGDRRSLKIIEKGLSEKDKNIKFHSVVALSNMKLSNNFDWTKVKSFLSSDDKALVQASVLALATHRVENVEDEIKPLLSNTDGFALRYAAATALVYYKEEVALPVLGEILSLDETSHGKTLSVDEIGGLKLNVLSAAKKVQWKRLEVLIDRMTQKEKDIKVKAFAEDVLKSFKE